MTVGDFCNAGNIEHVQPRIAEGFTEEQAGIGTQRGAPGIDVSRLDEGGFDAEP